MAEDNIILSNTDIQGAILQKIKKDSIYKSISEDFKPTVHFLENDKIRVELRMVNYELQEYVGGDIENMLTGLIGGYMALVVDEYVNNYDSIEMIFFDINGNQFKKRILVDDDIKSLKQAGYLRKNFNLMYNITNKSNRR